MARRTQIIGLWNFFGKLSVRTSVLARAPTRERSKAWWSTCAATCLLYQSRECVNSWGHVGGARRGATGRAGRLPGVAPPEVLHPSCLPFVSPNGYTGSGPASTGVEDIGMIHTEVRVWQLWLVSTYRSHSGRVSVGKVPCTAFTSRTTPHWQVSVDNLGNSWSGLGGRLSGLSGSRVLMGR